MKLKINPTLLFIVHAWTRAPQSRQLPCQVGGLRAPENQPYNQYRSIIYINQVLGHLFCCQCHSSNGEKRHTTQSHLLTLDYHTPHPIHRAIASSSSLAPVFGAERTGIQQRSICSSLVYQSSFHGCLLHPQNNINVIVVRRPTCGRMTFLSFSVAELHMIS